VSMRYRGQVAQIVLRQTDSYRFYKLYASYNSCQIYQANSYTTPGLDTCEFDYVYISIYSLFTE